MSREILDESVSAVMDGEADELELRRVLAAAGDDPQLRQRWARYQLARDVMHRQTVAPGLDLAARVSAALDAEPAVTAAAPAPAAAAAAPRPARWGLQLGRLAVAASVTLAVLVGVRAVNEQGTAGVAPQIAQQAAPLQQSLPPLAVPQGPAMLATFTTSDEAAAAPAQPLGEDDLLRELPAEGLAPSADGEPAGQ